VPDGTLSSQSGKYARYLGRLLTGAGGPSFSDQGARLLTGAGGPSFTAPADL